MHLPDLEACLQQAAQQSCVLAVLRHPEHEGMWTIALDGATALHAEWDAPKGWLRLWAELGPLADRQRLGSVQSLIARYAAAVERSRIGLGPGNTYELYSHWRVDLRCPEHLAALFDELAPVVATWREILARPPGVRPPPASVDHGLTDMRQRFMV
ncbi:MAG: type III secretion system chaperone [Hydrogenophaga sp.]|uniref:hypothetical protein n=1 Tax=Hydrogenophaga sp. TaxID=1904254 RepID=UPI001D490EDD|nr:hypothetical protein [Hydrogenophaga sp.]MBX3609678.1 type III secretion system chaperone [Hydrogenophaga sp.]